MKRSAHLLNVDLTMGVTGDPEKRTELDVAAMVADANWIRNEDGCMLPRASMLSVRR